MATEAAEHLDVIRRRIPIVAILLIGFTSLLIFNLANFQFFPRSVRQELEQIGSSITNSTVRVPAERGKIFDRDGEPLAFNLVQYRLGVSPSLVADAERLMQELSPILNLPEFELYRKITSDRVWEFLAGPISAEAGQAVAELDDISLVLEEIPRRFYPQGELAGHVIGVVVDDGLRGALGVEGAYNDILSGRVLDLDVSNVPLGLPQERPAEQRGQDIVLTIDRDIQYWVESELRAAVEEYKAYRGTIIVMDPRRGDVLALANYPSVDPNNFLSIAEPNLRLNPAVNDSYEPGTLMQVLTVAGALESGTINRDWTYEDGGYLQIGGRDIWNPYYQSHGTTDVHSILVDSLHIGAATIALEMGTTAFYRTMRDFGLGQATGVGLFAEEPGELRIPGDSNWNESFLGLNSSGQSVKVTAMQMVAAFAAIANDGTMRQPRILHRVLSEDGMAEAQPTTLRQVISPETARLLKDIMLDTVQESAPAAQLPGYSIAGMPGTARISTAVAFEEGNNSKILSFIGALPAEDPQVVVLVKLDRPDGEYGHQVAAPVFRRVAERLVILLEIPNDDTRAQLAAAQSADAQGGI